MKLPSFEDLLIENRYGNMVNVTMKQKNDLETPAKKWTEYDADAPSRSEYVIFNHDTPDKLKDTIKAQGGFENYKGELALPATPAEVNHIIKGPKNPEHIFNSGLHNRLNIGTSILSKHIVNASHLPHVDNDTSHYALLDVPMDMENDVKLNPAISKSKKGTYFVKIPKSLHDSYQESKKFLGKAKGINRGEMLILRRAGIDPLKTNRARMRIEVSNTMSPEQIEQLRNR